MPGDSDAAANPWTPNQEALMALDQALVSRITKRYNALAVSTLAGLSEEEKAELTNPSGPTFGEVLNPRREKPKRKNSKRRSARR